MSTNRPVRQPFTSTPRPREVSRDLPMYGIRSEPTAEERALSRALRQTTVKIGLCCG